MWKAASARSISSWPKPRRSSESGEATAGAIWSAEALLPPCSAEASFGGWRRPERVCGSQPLARRPQKVCGSRRRARFVGVRRRAPTPCQIANLKSLPAPLLSATARQGIPPVSIQRHAGFWRGSHARDLHRGGRERSPYVRRDGGKTCGYRAGGLPGSLRIPDSE